MKKRGIINPDLAYALADLGHMDSFVICDMGFPIPKDAKRIDLSVVAGMPEFLPVLKACLNEVAVQEMVLMEGVVSSNEYLHDQILHMVHNQEVGYIPNRFLAFEINITSSIHCMSSTTSPPITIVAITILASTSP